MVNQRVGRSTTSTTSRSRQGTGGPSGPAGQAVQQVTDTARETVSTATDTAKQQADSQLSKLSGGLEQVAQTLHQTGGNLRENDQAMLAGYIERAAGQVERASSYLGASSVNDVIDDVQSYARREPVVTIAVAVGIGFLAARLLKATVGGGTSSAGQTVRYQTPGYRSAAPMDQQQYTASMSAGSRYGNGA